MSGKVRIYTDGASRGNPGPASYAFLIRDEKGREIYRDSEFIGKTTNNRAEYNAVINALKKVLEITQGKVKVYSDSRLVVNQAEGNWKVKSEEIKPLVEEVRSLAEDFESVKFVHVSRENEMIGKVDKMCNQKLDEEA